MSETRFTTCNVCDAMCGLRVQVDGARVTEVRGDPDDPFSKGHVCPKAIGLRDVLDDPDRLRAPVVRDGAGWRTVGWEEALERAAEPLVRLRRTHGPDVVAIYVGNPVVHAHRSALAALLLSKALGTGNRFDANSQDSNPRLFACQQVYGDPLTMPVPDVDRTDLLLMLGANPVASNGSQMGLGDARARLQAIRDRGGRIVLIDPRRTESAAIADAHHFIRPGGDAALLLSMLHVLFAEDLIDRAFVEARTIGVDALRAAASRFPPERSGPAVGMDAEVIRRLAREFAAARSACAYARVGVAQSAFGPLTCWLVEALNLVTGNFDREGGVMFGRVACDVGPIARRLAPQGYGRWSSRVRRLPEFLDALPSSVISEEIETPGHGQIRAMVVLAGNPVLSTPNGERLARALPTLEHLVAIDYYIHETSRHASVILPPRHPFESGRYDMLMSRFAVRDYAKYNDPIVHTGDDLRDDWEIASELALRLRVPGVLRRPVRAALTDAPERLIDLLLRTGPHRLSIAALRKTPHGVDLGPMRPHGSSVIHTPGHRARLAPAPLLADLPRLEAWVDEVRRTELVLIGRRHVRSNNSWMHNVRSLTKGTDRSHLWMNPADASRRGLVDQAEVSLTGRTGTVRARLLITDDVMPGVVSLPHGYGHHVARDTLHIAGALPGPNINAVTDEQLVEPVIGTSILNGVPVQVEAWAGPEGPEPRAG